MMVSLNVRVTAPQLLQMTGLKAQLNIWLNLKIVNAVAR
jgi:hypothetical protein